MLQGLGCGRGVSRPPHSGPLYRTVQQPQSFWVNATRDCSSTVVVTAGLWLSACADKGSGRWLAVQRRPGCEHGALKNPNFGV